MGKLDRKDSEAFVEGLRDGLRGLPPTDCPFPISPLARDWLLGQHSGNIGIQETNKKLGLNSTDSGFDEVDEFYILTALFEEKRFYWCSAKDRTILVGWLADPSWAYHYVNPDINMSSVKEAFTGTHWSTIKYKIDMNTVRFAKCKLMLERDTILGGE